MEQQAEAGGARASTCRPWCRSALDSGLRTFVEVTLVACLVVLVLSKHEKPRVPLRLYVVGYLCGCVSYFISAMFRCYIAGGPLGRPGAALWWFDILLACFFLAWVVPGCVLVSKAGSDSSDTPLLFGSSLVAVISSGINGALELTIRCIAI
uniref:Uncharacterized protein n=1 Tax=Kalanchoe fedtschenkoi TaxID=63787 RepID=A0A7N0V1E9_KALFE